MAPDELAGEELLEFCRNPHDFQAVEGVRTLILTNPFGASAKEVDMTKIACPLLEWLDHWAHGDTPCSPTCRFNVVSALPMIFQRTADAILQDSMSSLWPGAVLYDLTAITFAKQFINVISPLPAAEAQEPYLEPFLEPILRGLTMGASLAGEMAGNVIKVGALKLACESLPDILDEALSTVSARPSWEGPHAYKLSADDGGWLHVINRTILYVRCRLPTCCGSNCSAEVLLEAQELQGGIGLADIFEEAAGLPCAAAASSSAPASTCLPLVCMAVIEAIVHVVMDQVEVGCMDDVQQDSARRYAQRLGLAAARLLEERGVTAAMRRVLDSAASPGLQSALAAFQQSAASLGPGQVLGLEQVVSLARAMACAALNCQLPSQLTPASLAALMFELGAALRRCVMVKRFMFETWEAHYKHAGLPLSLPVARLAGLFAQGLLGFTNVMMAQVGPTMEPEWLLACHGAVGAVRACGAVLPADDREGERAAGKATKNKLRKVVQAEFDWLDDCKIQVEARQLSYARLARLAALVKAKAMVSGEQERGWLDEIATLVDKLRRA